MDEERAKRGGVLGPPVTGKEQEASVNAEIFVVDMQER